MDDNLTDQQRAEQVRGWFGANIWFLLAGLVLGLGALFGWRQWTEGRAQRAEQASALYEEMLTAIRVGRAVRAEEIAGELERDYTATPYLDQARLAMARLKMDGSRPEEAARYLEQVVAGPASAELRDIARLRLARVLIQMEKYEEAIRQLAPPQDSAFAARYHEVRGDAYYAMGRRDDARSEYQAALEQVAESPIDPALLQAKLDEVGGAAAPATTASTAP